MGRRKPIHYFGAALILLFIGAAANMEIFGLGRASGSNETRDSSADSALTAPGGNAFSRGKMENLDFAFYEEFLRNRNQNGDGFIADKTGQWSKGSNTTGGAGETSDLQKVSQLETIYSTPSPIHGDGSIGVGAPLTGDLFGAAFFNDTPVPGLIPSGFDPNATPPVAEVPIPPPAILFVSAIAGFAFARRRNKG
jgi:hypothetical protein